MKQTLPVWIDFAAPDAYLAQPGLRVLAAEFNLALDWRPLRVKQSPIPAAKPNETRSESHQRVRAEYRRANHERYAAALGLPMIWRDTPLDTTLALSGLAWLTRSTTISAANPAETIDHYVAATFAAYWQDNTTQLNESDVQTLLCETPTPEQFEAPKFTSYLKSEAAADMTRHAEEALECGMIDVPGVWLANEPWIGRQHLPMLRQILSGVGP